MAEMGTPFGSSHEASITGHCPAGVVKRALGWAAFRPESGVHSCPFQSISLSGRLSVICSHHTSLSGVKATLVKIEFFVMVSMALGLESIDVPGATPKKPYSGLIAWSL